MAFREYLIDGKLEIPEFPIYTMKTSSVNSACFCLNAGSRTKWGTLIDADELVNLHATLIKVMLHLNGIG